MITTIVFDVGETLTRDDRHWGRWAVLVAGDQTARAGELLRALDLPEDGPPRPPAPAFGVSREYSRSCPGRVDHRPP